jgi:ABC-2 type transport system permease protein
VTTLIAINVIHPTPALAIALAVLLLLANRLGWRLVSAMFDRERLVTGDQIMKRQPSCECATQRPAQRA